MQYNEDRNKKDDSDEADVDDGEVLDVQDDPSDEVSGEDLDDNLEK